MKFIVVADLDKNRSTPERRSFLKEADSLAHLMAKLDHELAPTGPEHNMATTTMFFNEALEEDGSFVYCCPDPNMVGHTAVYIDGFGTFEVFCLDAVDYFPPSVQEVM